jgi:hypothetical protein
VKQGEKRATPLQYFPDFSQLPAEVDHALLHCAHTSSELTVLMARYYATLNTKAA